MKWFDNMKSGFNKRQPLIAAALMLMAVQPAMSAEWSDLSLGYEYGTQFREPGIDSFVQKNIFNYTNINGYKHGSNFVSLDVLFSDIKDPANGGDSGAQELFFVYNHQFGYGKMVNGKPLNYGILKDISLMIGTDLNAKNNAFACSKEAVYAGPVLNLTIPTPTPGFLDASVRFYKEWNHNGITSRSVEFDPTYMLSLAWGIPLNTPVVPLNFKGFANLIGEKGKDGFDSKTKVEILMRSYLMADIGAPMGKANFAWLGVGLEYWNNKFGSANAANTNEPTICPMINFELHPF
jgi:hypothetical protein